MYAIKGTLSRGAQPSITDLLECNCILVQPEGLRLPDAGILKFPGWRLSILPTNNINVWRKGGVLDQEDQNYDHDNDVNDNDQWKARLGQGQFNFEYSDLMFQLGISGGMKTRKMRTKPSDLVLTQLDMMQLPTKQKIRESSMRHKGKTVTVKQVSILIQAHQH